MILFRYFILLLRIFSDIPMGLFGVCSSLYTCISITRSSLIFERTPFCEYYFLNIDYVQVICLYGALLNIALFNVFKEKQEADSFKISANTLHMLRKNWNVFCGSIAKKSCQVLEVYDVRKLNGKNLVWLCITFWTLSVIGFRIMLIERIIIHGAFEQAYVTSNIINISTFYTYYIYRTISNISAWLKEYRIVLITDFWACALV